MLRNVLALFLAVVAGSAGIYLVQAISHQIYPPPEGLDYSDPEQVKQFVAQLPLGALLMVELSYVVGSLAAGLLLGKFALSHHRLLALGVGVFFTIMNIWNLVQIPHPLWLAILTMVTFIPLAWYGAKITAPK